MMIVAASSTVHILSVRHGPSGHGIAHEPPLHLAPGKPALIHSMLFMLAGGLTHSASKVWMSSITTIFLAGSYFVRPIAIDWIAWCPLPSFIWIFPPGDSHSAFSSAAAISSGLGFLPPLLAMAF